ncbi:MAG: DegV family protein [Actinomycetota bacterium]|nr:DegV family protein [Actinomycetota bacterium]
MENIAIVTDTTADIPKRLASNNEITVVPLNVGYGGRLYKDREEINNRVLFKKLREGVKIFTSTPSVGEFVETYRHLIEDKKKNLIYSIHLSSKLSTTFNSASQAKKFFPGVDIKIIDSKSAAIGMGFIALEAARAAKRGENRERIEEIIDYLIRNNKLFAAIDNFKYLFVGGRAPFLGKFLSMSIRLKPIVTLGRDGKVKLIKFVRNKKNSRIEIYWQLKKSSYPGKKRKIGIFYGEDINTALELEKIIKSDDKIEIDELILTEVTSVMSAHTGPGIWGLSVCPVINHD